MNNLEHFLLTRIASISSQLQVISDRQDTMIRVINAQSNALVCIEQRYAPLTVD
jgi:hypothetical protein